MKQFIALSLAIIAACAAVFVFSTKYRPPTPHAQTPAQHEASAVAQETARETAREPSPAQAPVKATDAGKPAPSTTQKLNEAAAAVAALTPAPKISAKVSAQSGPAFDVARVNEDGGEAVIAGRAAPGATVELLRDGQVHDSAVADAAGQFVMTPPPLPPGKHELTLRAKAPDGTVVQSNNGVSVAVNAAAPSSGATPPSVDVATAAKTEPIPKSVRQAHAATEPTAHAASVHRHHPTASVVARVSSDAIPRATDDAIPGLPQTKVVSRGDSLWLISRLAYGDGMRYALIFNANRDRIRNPNRIYPGQTFVLPSNAR